MFTMIRLETSNGRFVRNGEIAKFLPGHEPMVILWGDRCFVQTEKGSDTYRESFCIPLIDR